MIAGSELGEHPFEPITHESKRRAAELGDDLPVEWRHRDERYAEKLATPDTSVADLIGDVDPMKVAEGRSLGDPETIHFGLIPRSHRGIVAINELPDLAERIQVAMLNVMEERDIQIRGYVLRLPLDVLVVASANPEDYTNRGRIITPLKDRFGAEIRTHYPTELEDEIAVIRQEADLTADVPDHLVEVLARFTRNLRESSAVDQRSGVSARFAIAGAETIAAAAIHRATAQGEDDAVARVVDLETAVDVLGGKIEFETGEEGRETEVLTHLLRTAMAETVREHFRGSTSRSWWTRSRAAGWSRRASRSPPATSWPGCRCWGSPSCTTRCATASTRRTTANAPVRSSSPSRGSTSRARSARTATAGRPSTAEPSWLIGHTPKPAPASRYGRYDGGDPLAPPVDIAEALDAIGQDVMAGYSPERAMREFLRRGGQDQSGLDDLARRVAERRRELTQQHNLDGTLQEIRELLDKAVLEERKQLARDVDDGRRRPGAARDAAGEPPAEYRVRGQRAGVVRLAEPRGPGGLRADQGPARPRAARPAVRGHEERARERDRRGPRRHQRDAQDLNELLEKHQRGEDTQEDFDEFMGKHGDYFPENPQNIDELLDAMAKRAAAAQRMLNSMSRRAARRADAALAAGVRLTGADGVALPARLQPPVAPPGEDWGGWSGWTARRGSVSATAPASSRTSPTSTTSPSSWASPTAAPGWTTSTSTSWPASSATTPGRREDPQELEQALRESGTLRRGTDGTLRLTPKAMRQLGKALLRDVAEKMSGRQGAPRAAPRRCGRGPVGRHPQLGVRRHRAVARPAHDRLGWWAPDPTGRRSPPRQPETPSSCCGAG